MRLKSEQLAQQLQQQLLPVYLIHGDEPLLVEEAADVVRSALRQHQAERQVWHVEGRFDWTQIPWQAQSMSLFASRRLLEIRLPSGSPGKEGSELLRNFASQPAEDTTVLIISGKIAPAQQKAKWYSELERIGATVMIWPVTLDRLPAWIRQRAAQRGVSFNADISAVIAERVEGNLFAAAQEVDKLALLADNGHVEDQMVLASVADNARFEAFGLMDQIYAGQIDRIPRTIRTLQAEGVEILSVFSAVSWSVQRCVDMALQLQQGRPLQQIFASQKPPVWEKSQAMIRRALMRHQPQQWLMFLQQLSLVDQAAKGGLSVSPWQLLEALCLQLAGVQLNTATAEIRGDFH
ncbi:DNA polymerase III subunit delta [Methylophaga lonarensis MPL]|uniref:DNA polymerase III subunit delta n=1 Tax=Methylophaga lonarensis MPL TaxID=1286106 RepID=M7PGL8_9GAMM|nr:DNA polymerase III subunit delta [Methylophaga lonarensis]EMR13040.1 DNA polymerase III subunit delta [Methylophaga lonarensis MPL]